MTIERARELLEVDAMSDEEIQQFIVVSKQMCKELLKTIVKEKSNKNIDKTTKIMDYE